MTMGCVPIAGCHFQAWPGAHEHRFQMAARKKKKDLHILDSPHHFYCKPSDWPNLNQVRFVIFIGGVTKLSDCISYSYFIVPPKKITIYLHFFVTSEEKILKHGHTTPKHGSLQLNYQFKCLPKCHLGISTQHKLIDCITPKTWSQSTSHSITDWKPCWKRQQPLPLHFKRLKAETACLCLAKASAHTSHSVAAAAKMHQVWNEWTEHLNVVHVP